MCAFKIWKANFPLDLSVYLSAGGSLPLRVQILASGCFWRTEWENGRRQLRWRKSFPPSATTPTWCPRMARWPVTAQEFVSELQLPTEAFMTCIYFTISGSAVQEILWSVCLFPDVLRFDNTYSIFQAKRVSFTVEVLLPDHLQSPKTNGGANSQS